MDFIIGGAYQGKLTWAMAQYPLKPEQLLDLGRSEPRPAPCWYHLESLTWRQACAGGSAKALLERLHPLLPGTMAIISREIGSGVVPMTPEERNWRELHGQVLQALANRADRVFRIFCGLPEVLK